MKKFVQFMWECNSHQPKDEGEESPMMRSGVRVAEGEEGGESPKRAVKKDMRCSTLKSNRKVEQSGADRKR